ncbi:MAG: hypothetical protein PHS07_02855 [Patescibacteria group bacterium]|jgi:translation elongation factor EF-Tu-like GTPase|nr:hypothetical protein [Patescibacteria group bacterium]
MISKNIFEIEDIFSIEGIGIIVAGTLKNGNILKGMKTIINGKTAEVASIEQYHKKIDMIDAVGSSAGLLLKGVEKKDISLGEIFLQ